MLDIATVPILEEALDHASALNAERVILDVRELSFVDASGLKAVLRASNAPGRRLTLQRAGRHMRHIFEFIGVTPLVGFEEPDRDAPPRMGELNIAYIRRLWDAFATEGARAVAQLVDDDAEWKPLGAGGRVLRGTEQLIDFWASEASPPPTPHSFIAVANRVLVGSELHR